MKQETYEFQCADFKMTEDGKADFTKPRELWASKLDGSRGKVEYGQRFTAEMAEEVTTDHRGVTPKEVKTGRFYVVSSNTDFRPGDLTSIIRTGRAKLIQIEQKQTVATNGKK